MCKQYFVYDFGDDGTAVDLLLLLFVWVFSLSRIDIEIRNFEKIKHWMEFNNFHHSHWLVVVVVAVEQQMDYFLVHPSYHQQFGKCRSYHFVVDYFAVQFHSIGSWRVLVALDLMEHHVEQDDLFLQQPKMKI